MNRRRSNRIQSALDASFQIPFAVNATANNLLMDDDALENDFFDGGLDYSLSTLVPVRASSSKVQLSDLDVSPQGEGLLDHVQPDPRNGFGFDEDYNMEEQEMEKDNNNAGLGTGLFGDQPRRVRMSDSPDRELTPTPRAPKHKHGLERPKLPSLRPTPILSSPVLHKDFLAELHEADSRTNTVEIHLRRSRSPSATPKPKLRPKLRARSPSETLPSLRSASSVTASSALPSRPDKAQLRAKSREPDDHMEHHKHASNARRTSHLISGSGSVLEAQLSQAAPAPTPVEVSPYDPHMPEEHLSRPPEATRPRRPSSLQRRPTRSRTRSASPSTLPRTTQDGAMLPIQEVDEDLHDRGKDAPISKHPAQATGTGEPQKRMAVALKAEARHKDKGKEKEKATDSATSSSSVVSAHRTGPKPRLPTKPVAKRDGDILKDQPVPKKRKTDVKEVQPGSKPHDSASSRASPARPNPDNVALTSASNAAIDMSEVDKHHDHEPRKATPVEPESNFRPLSPIHPAHLKFNLSSETLPPDSSSNVKLAQQGSNEEADEVQNFLARYAKNYGSAIDAPSTTLPNIPKASSSIDSTNSHRNSQPSTHPQKHRDTVPEPDIKRTRTKVKRQSTKTELKVKSNFKDPLPRRGDEKVVPENVGASITRSPSPSKISEIGASKRHASQTLATIDEYTPVSSNLNSTAHNAPSVSSTSRLIDPMSKEMEVFLDGVQVDISGLSLPPLEVSPDEAASCFTNIGGYDAKVVELTDSRAFEDPAPASSASAPSALSGLRTETSESSKPLKSETKPNSSRGSSRREEKQPHDAKERPPTRKSSVPPVPQVLRRKLSVEPRADDMFARKKRDNYLQKGLDLTAHSSRRHSEKSEHTPSIMLVAEHAHLTSRQTSSALIVDEPPATVAVAKASRSSTAAVTSIHVPVKASQSSTAVSDLAKVKKDHKVQVREPKVLERKDRLTGKTHRSSRKDDPSNSQGKDIVKPDVRSRGKGSTRATSKLSASSRGQAGRQSEPILEEGGNTSSGSIGSVIAEHLFSFSQKIMGSFGLLSSQSQTDTAEHLAVESDVRPSHLPDVVNDTDHLDPSNSRGSRKRLHKPSAQLSPRKGQHNQTDNVHDESINSDNKKRVHGSSRRPHKGSLDKTLLEGHSRVENAGNDVLDAASDTRLPIIHDGISKMNSRKRPAGEEPEQSYDKVTDNDTKFAASDRSRKRTRLLRDESAFAAGSTVPSNTSRSDQSREMRASSRTRLADAENVSRGALASSNLIAVGESHIPDTHSAEASNSSNPSVHLDNTENGELAQAPCSLTIPMAPAFTSDVLRQRRLLAKSEREKRQREKITTKKIRPSKSDGSSSTAPSSSKQPVHEPLKSTVPYTFRFETDSRSNDRKKEFEAKLKTWEHRASIESSSNSLHATRKPLPDFRGLHAAQGASLSNMAARRREAIAPTKPVAPHFVMDNRLAERQKFEDARRTREEQAERMREEKQRMREEEEEREWREARKRAVPRANVVPEWYANAPKKPTLSK